MFWLAFAIGAGVLWLFAQDQFNHPSWKDDDRLTRILSVPHLRGDRVRKRALFVYFVLLLLVYAIFVFFGGAIVAALDAGVASPQSMAGGAAAQPLALPGPAVPFAVSLAIVGIAPRIELLTRVEEKIRVAAHEMMGLPRGLLSSGLTIADTELTVEQIGELNVNPLDLEQFRRHVDAAGAVFGRNAGKVRLFEKRLLKLVAYKVWVIDRIWPASKVREPYDVLEASFATDMAACLADLDVIAAVPLEGMTPADRLALCKRWEDRMNATIDLSGEVCALLFIYFEKQNPAGGASGDPIRRSISEFFERATAGRTTSPELDIAVRSILGAVAVAAVWGYLGTMLRPQFELSPGNPGVGALVAALGALFLYGPVIAIAIWSNARVSENGTLRRGIGTSRRLGTAIGCYVVSLVFLVVLNVSQAVVGGATVTADAIQPLGYAALLTEAPMAMLGALQGYFALAYLEVYADPENVEDTRRWRAIALNVVAMVLLAVVVTYLIVAAFETVGRWSNPALVRLPTPADFVARVPAAGLVALIIGWVMTSALSSRFCERGSRAAPREVPA